MLKAIMKNKFLPDRLLQSILAATLSQLMILPAADALSSDSEKTMNIEADKVILNEKDGVSNYLGHVKFTQGSRSISGDSISIHQKGNEIIRIVIKGKPALFSQLNDNNEETRASSLEMIYHANKDMLILKQEAMLKQKDNVFHSDLISYNTAKDIITAGQEGTQESDKDEQRVKITIHPKKDSNSK